LHLFDPGGGLVSDHPLHKGRIHEIAFHRQANTAICVSEDGDVTVFDTEHRRLLHRIPVTTGKLFSVAVLNSQLVAVAGSDNVIRVVNTDEGTVVRELEGHAGSVSTLAAAGGLLFSGSYDATLRRWSIGDIDASGQRIAEGDPRIDR
jgi:WD40 repeat protein